MSLTDLAERLREAIRLIDSGRPSHARYEIGKALDQVNQEIKRPRDGKRS